MRVLSWKTAESPFKPSPFCASMSKDTVIWLFEQIETDDGGQEFSALLVSGGDKATYRVITLHCVNTK